MHYNPERVRLGGVLSPPYDVIGSEEQEALYGRNLRNVVRIELGREFTDDVPGERDRYTRARDHLESWLKLGVLVRDPAPAYYVTSHEFELPTGGTATRRGVFGTVASMPWDRSLLVPHERTLNAPKQDRLTLLRATGVQTSPVFALAADSDGLESLLDRVTSGPALLGGRTEGELGPEKHLLWRCDSADVVRATASALATARFYVADGHHRYETMAAYAAEVRSRLGRDPADADVAPTLVYAVAAADPTLLILPTHRLVRPAHGVAFSLDDLWARLDDAFELERTPDLPAAVARAGEMRASHHAFAAVARDGAAVLSRVRRDAPSPRAALDVVVLEDEVLAPAGVGEQAVAAGALVYTRSADDLDGAVRGGEAVLGFAVNPVSVAQVIAVSDASEVMPQKSTYFYPKVATGLVLNPVLPMAE